MNEDLLPTKVTIDQGNLVRKVITSVRCVDGAEYSTRRLG